MKHGSDAGSASDLAKSLLRDHSAFGYFEPSLQHTFLPRCPSCNAVHPRARKPSIDRDTCPDCGGPVAVSDVAIDVPAVVTDWKFTFGNFLMWCGSRLNRLSQRI